MNRLRSRRVGTTVQLTPHLPDFVVAGVPRAGTTTLAGHLRSVPEVFLPARKELHYFTLNRHRGLAWYSRHFAAARPGQVLGDVTPAYLLHEDAVAHLAETLPGAVVVVVLRDPVDRAYSHFRLNQWKGVERLSFEEALRAEPRRLEADPSAMPHAYVASGEYVRLLATLFEHVPRSQVEIVLFDDLAADPTLVVTRLCRRLGVPPPPRVEAVRSNHHGPVRSAWVSTAARHLPGPVCRAVRDWNTGDGEYPAMAPATEDLLVRHFAARNAGLDRILGRPVPWETREGGQA